MIWVTQIRFKTKCADSLLMCIMQIYEHKVDNVIMGDPPMLRSPLMVTLNLVRQPAQQPYPTPWLPQPRLWLPDCSTRCELTDDYLQSPPGAA